MFFSMSECPYCKNFFRKIFLQMLRGMWCRFSTNMSKKGTNQRDLFFKAQNRMLLKTHFYQKFITKEVYYSIEWTLSIWSIFLFYITECAYNSLFLCHYSIYFILVKFVCKMSFLIQRIPFKSYKIKDKQQLEIFK